jgi:predicted metalloendopeptidase
VNKETFKVFHYIKNSIIEAIKQAQWMDDQTKKEALEKALRMGSLFQMPDFEFPTKKMESCSKKAFISNYLQRKNAVESVIWEFHSSNRVKWGLQEHFYFAYDSDIPSYSQINGLYEQISNVFKVYYGILGSPFLDVDAPYAVKFGGLRTIIGHEISQ